MLFPLVAVGIPTDGYKARSEAKPVGFTDYLSNFFSYFCLHYINIDDTFVILTLSTSMRVYLINAITVNNVPIEEHKSVLKAFSQWPA